VKTGLKILLLNSTRL